MQLHCIGAVHGLVLQSLHATRNCLLTTAGTVLYEQSGWPDRAAGDNSSRPAHATPVRAPAALLQPILRTKQHLKYFKPLKLLM
jgi:hypothetical protein